MQCTWTRRQNFLKNHSWFSRQFICGLCGGFHSLVSGGRFDFNIIMGKHAMEIKFGWIFISDPNGFLFPSQKKELDEETVGYHLYEKSPSIFWSEPPAS